MMICIMAPRSTALHAAIGLLRATDCTVMCTLPAAAAVMVIAPPPVGCAMQSRKRANSAGIPLSRVGGSTAGCMAGEMCRRRRVPLCLVFTLRHLSRLGVLLVHCLYEARLVRGLCSVRQTDRHACHPHRNTVGGMEEAPKSHSITQGDMKTRAVEGGFNKVRIPPRQLRDQKGPAPPSSRCHASVTNLAMMCTSSMNPLNSSGQPGSPTAASGSNHVIDIKLSMQAIGCVQRLWRQLCQPRRLVSSCTQCNRYASLINQQCAAGQWLAASRRAWSASHDAQPLARTVLPIDCTHAPHRVQCVV